MRGLMEGSPCATGVPRSDRHAQCVTVVMATHIHPSTDRGGPLEVPKRGPNWTFYVFTGLAALVAVATYVGFRYAGIVR
jgi:hypothetical protein